MTRRIVALVIALAWGTAVPAVASAQEDPRVLPPPRIAVGLGDTWIALGDGDALRTSTSPPSRRSWKAVFKDGIGYELLLGRALFVMEPWDFIPGRAPRPEGVIGPTIAAGLAEHAGVGSLEWLGGSLEPDDLRLYRLVAGARASFAWGRPDAPARFHVGADGAVGGVWLPETEAAYDPPGPIGPTTVGLYRSSILACAEASAFAGLSVRLGAGTRLGFEVFAGGRWTSAPRAAAPSAVVSFDAGDPEPILEVFVGFMVTIEWDLSRRRREPRPTPPQDLWKETPPGR
ncbi:MAG: hypothetical protein L0216_07675 [Planctomycetales bacterium]|nr:hypothetical protein [Planctomycetales bacterium]